MKSSSRPNGRRSPEAPLGSKASAVQRLAYAWQGNGPGKAPGADEFYRRIVETTQEGIWMADLRDVTCYANARMARMLRTTPAAMVGRSVFDFVYREDYATVRRHFKEFRRARNGREVEQRLRRADGSAMWTMVAASVMRGRRGSPIGYLGMFTDITDRKLVEEALAKSEARLQLQIRRMPIGYVFLSSDFRVAAWNPAAEKMFGYTAREVSGKHPYDLFVPEGARTHTDRIWRRLLRGDGSVRSVNANVRKDGRVIFCEWSNTPIKDDSGTVIGVLSMVVDITERLKTEERLRQIMGDLETRVQSRTAELQASNRALLDLQREILAVSEREQRRLGHDLHDDLCQQLAGIQFLSQTLAGNLGTRGALETSQAIEIARMVQHAMKQTRELARGLSPVRFEAEGLSDALTELALRTRNVFRIRCKFHCAGPVLVADHTAAVHLYRIAQEAVSNAVKHARASRITLRLSNRRRQLQLRISDDGVGIAPQRDERGGMGLQIMQYRAQVIGAVLSVQRQPRGGTAVVCTIVEGLRTFEPRKPK